MPLSFVKWFPVASFQFPVSGFWFLVSGFWKRLFYAVGRASVPAPGKDFSVNKQLTTVN
jgi:hypothetical protein